MFKTLSRSWQVLKASFEIFRADPELIIFPGAAAAALLVVTLLFAMPIFGAGLFQSIAARSQVYFGAILSTLIFGVLYYVCVYVLAVFSNTAMVKAASIRLGGGNPTPEDGIQIIRGRFGAILTYGLIAATIGTVIRTLKNQKTGLIGTIHESLGGLRWSVATYLAVPVLAANKNGAVESIRESAATIKKSWGENLAANINLALTVTAIGIAAAVVLGLPLFILMTATRSTVLAVLSWTFLVLVIGGIVLFGGALISIYQAALYQYATTGKVAKGFEESQLKGAFTQVVEQD